MTIRIDYDVLAGRAECSRSEDHTPLPAGMGTIEFHKLAWDSGRRPRQCRTCGLFVIWSDPLEAEQPRLDL